MSLYPSSNQHKQSSRWFHLHRYCDHYIDTLQKYRVYLSIWKVSLTFIAAEFTIMAFVRVLLIDMWKQNTYRDKTWSTTGVWHIWRSLEPCCPSRVWSWALQLLPSCRFPGPCCCRRHTSRTTGSSDTLHTCAAPNTSCLKERHKFAPEALLNGNIIPAVRRWRVSVWHCSAVEAFPPGSTAEGGGGSLAQWQQQQQDSRMEALTKFRDFSRISSLFHFFFFFFFFIGVSPEYSKVSRPSGRGQPQHHYTNEASNDHKTHLGTWLVESSTPCIVRREMTPHRSSTRRISVRSSTTYSQFLCSFRRTRECSRLRHTARLCFSPSPLLSAGNCPSDLPSQVRIL